MNLKGIRRKYRNNPGLEAPAVKAFMAADRDLAGRDRYRYFICFVLAH
jgi:hypothetical protein